MRPLVTVARAQIEPESDVRMPAAIRMPRRSINSPQRVKSRHRLKREAVVAGREIARGLRVEHTIHREDGRISEKNSYGNDPFPPKDGR